MNEQKVHELIRAQGRLIALLQTEIASTAIAAMTMGYETTYERSQEAKALRDQISTFKGELYT